jgi:release factor glutamine methyltransferase
MPGPGEPWTVLQVILWSADYLAERGVERGRLDAEHLLAAALGLGRLDLYLQYDRPLTPDELDRFKRGLRRRAAREPLQYVLGTAAFRDLELKVDPRVLIPRPETEVLVEEALKAAGDLAARSPANSGLTALDLGTGSGAVALALASEGPFRRVVATDPSPEALEVAKENARALALEERVEFRAGPLFEPLGEGETFHVVVSNPPYVPTTEASELQPEVLDWEPGAALFAGPDGLAVLEPLIRGAGRHLRPGGVLALEAATAQIAHILDLMSSSPHLTGPTVSKDLAGRDRVVTAKRTTNS